MVATAAPRDARDVSGAESFRHGLESIAEGARTLAEAVSSSVLRPARWLQAEAQVVIAATSSPTVRDLSESFRESREEGTSAGERGSVLPTSAPAPPPPMAPAASVSVEPAARSEPAAPSHETSAAILENPLAV